MNLHLRHGTASRWVRRYKTPAGAVIDMTGGTLAGKIKAEAGGEELGELTFEWVDQANGAFAQIVPVAVVNAIPDGVFRWDLIYTDSLGTPHLLDEGTCTKSGTITGTP